MTGYYFARRNDDKEDFVQIKKNGRVLEFLFLCIFASFFSLVIFSVFFSSFFDSDTDQRKVWKSLTNHPQDFLRSSSGIL